MFGKLLKYDLKTSLRHTTSLYVTLFAIAIALSVASIIKVFWIMTLLVAAMYIVGIIVIAMTFYVLAKSFNETMFRAQGYLSFTLPVKTSSLLLSKLLVCIMWTIISVVILGLTILLSYQITTMATTGGSLSSIIDLIKESGILDALPNKQIIVNYLFIMGLQALIVLLTFWSTALFSITAANTSRFQAHPKAYGIGVFIALSYVTNAIAAFMTQVIPLSVVLSKDSVTLQLKSMIEETEGIFTAGIGGTIFSVVMAVVVVFATTWLIENKVDVKG